MPAKPDSAPQSRPEGGTGTGRRAWVTCTAGIQVAPATLDYLAADLQAARQEQDALPQAGCRHPGPGHHRLTAHQPDWLPNWRAATAPTRPPCGDTGEGITVLAGRAVRLRDVLRLARKMGWKYLLLDGTVISAVAFGPKITARQAHHSGKRKGTGVNIQAVRAPDGTLLRASAALPGKTHDVTAYRARQLRQRLAEDFATSAGLGHKGAMTCGGSSAASAWATSWPSSPATGSPWAAERR